MLNSRDPEVEKKNVGVAAILVEPHSYKYIVLMFCFVVTIAFI